MCLPSNADAGVCVLGLTLDDEEGSVKKWEGTCDKPVWSLGSLVPPALAPVVVAVAVVGTFPRVVPAAVAVAPSAVAVAVVVSISTERFVVSAAGASIASSAPVTTAASAVAISAAVAAKPTSWPPGTCRSTVRWAIAVGALVADAAAPASKSTPTAAPIAAKAAPEAPTVASTIAEAAATPSTTPKTATEPSAAPEPTRTSGRAEASRPGRACSRAFGVATTAEASAKATGAPARDCATALDIDQHASVLDLDAVRLLVGGLHVLLALVHDEGVAALPLLGRRVGRRSRVLDNADALNGTVAAKLALEVVRRRAVREARDEQRLEGVALHLGVFAGLVCALLV